MRWLCAGTTGRADASVSCSHGLASGCDDLGRQVEPASSVVPGEVEVVASPLGNVTRVVPPGVLDGRPLQWAGPPSALGAAEPAFP